MGETRSLRMVASRRLLARRIVLALAIVGLVAAQALALPITVDGNVDDWGIAPGPWGTSDWVPFAEVQGTWPPAEQDFPDDANSGQVIPGHGGQPFDAEALYFAYDANYAYFAIVTGLPPTGARGELAGDLALAFGLAGPYTHAVETTGDGGLLAGGLYENVAWRNGYWGPKSDPAAIITGDLVAGPPDTQLVYASLSGAHYVIEVAVPLSLLPVSMDAPTPFRAHWTETCGNDAVDMTGLLPLVPPPPSPFDDPVVPEPTTMALLGGALAALAARRRRRSARP